MGIWYKGLLLGLCWDYGLHIPSLPTKNQYVNLQSWTLRVESVRCAGGCKALDLGCGF